MITLKEAYKCEHCRKLYEIQKAAIKHVETCTRNPVNIRPCFGCKHFTSEEAYLAGNEVRVKAYYCNKKEVFLHSPKSQANGKKYEFEYTENVPMPIECSDCSPLFDTENPFA